MNAGYVVVCSTWDLRITSLSARIRCRRDGAGSAAGHNMPCAPAYGAVPRNGMRVSGDGGIRVLGAGYPSPPRLGAVEPSGRAILAFRLIVAAAWIGDCWASGLFAANGRAAASLWRRRCVHRQTDNWIGSKGQQQRYNPAARLVLWPTAADTEPHTVFQRSQISDFESVTATVCG